MSQGTMYNDSRKNLTKLAEECNEVAIAVSKVKLFGWNDKKHKTGKTNREKLEEEIGHILFWVDVIVKHGRLSRANINKAKEEKFGTAGKYYNYEGDSHEL
jgi:NTP pyrophosphatase (non-canonical NTP hydrolase)